MVLRIAVLAVARQRLQREIRRSNGVKDGLRQSIERITRRLQASRRGQERSRHAVRRFLAADEQDRRRISLVLHDEISQNLLGINVSMIMLNMDPTKKPDRFRSHVTHAQRLVLQSAISAGRFARKFGVRHEK